MRWIAVLMVIGAGWGLSQPLTKIIVTTGLQPLGIIFWQLIIGAVVLGAVILWRRIPATVTRARLVVWVFIAVIGTVLPNFFSYRAAFHLPAGVMSLVIATVPMLAFPIAIALGGDRFSLIRLAGLMLGLAGVALIALPESSLPDRAMVAFLPIALIAPLCYAIEGNVVARWGVAGLHPVAVLFGASAIGAVIALPLAGLSGQFFWPAEATPTAAAALILSAVIHALVYAGYVWVIGRTGPVFAGQVAYLVTATGVGWSILLLGEVYSAWIWAALLVMMAGLGLVLPRPGLAQVPATRKTDPGSTAEPS